MLLSASIIVRDEERHLGACLESIQPVVDEIVVVDTGSRDETKQIAEAHGARVFELAWRDDFAAARNFALSRSRGDWILYIDADERLCDHNPTALRTILGAPNLVGCRVRLQARMGYTAFPELRLFRNDPRIRFEGVIHENIWPAIARYIEASGGEVADSDLELEHVGYDGPQDHKHRRNLPLLRESLKRDPTHAYCWHHLGTIHEALDEQAQAREAWRNGIAAVRKSGHLRASDSLLYVSLVQSCMKTGEEVGELLQEARRLFPRNAQFIWLEGHAHMNAGRFEDAVAAFEQTLDAQKQNDMDDNVGYDQRLFGIYTFNPLATCLFRLQCYGAARHYYELAEQADPDSPEYKIKRQLCANLEKSLTDQG